MTYRNFAHNSNFFFGTKLFGEETLYSIQSCNLPGLSFSHINASRQSVNLNLQGDTITYNDLDINIIIDENLKTWIDIVKTLQKMREPQYGISDNFDEISWLEIHDDNTNRVLKLEFYGTMIEGIGDLDFNTVNDDEIMTVSVTLKYDYYKIEDNNYYSQLPQSSQINCSE